MTSPGYYPSTLPLDLIEMIGYYTILRNMAGGNYIGVSAGDGYVGTMISDYGCLILFEKHDNGVSVKGIVNADGAITICVRNSHYRWVTVKNMEGNIESLSDPAVRKYAEKYADETVYSTMIREYGQIYLNKMRMFDV